MCHGPARYVERRARTFTNVLGDLTLERAYFHCAACGCGFCPRDRALGLADSTLSPGVTRMVGAVGATVSFDEGHQSTNIRVSAAESGLPRDTVFLGFQIRSLDPSRFLDRESGVAVPAGHLPDHRIEELAGILRKTLEL